MIILNANTRRNFYLVSEYYIVMAKLILLLVGGLLDEVFDKMALLQIT